MHIFMLCSIHTIPYHTIYRMCSIAHLVICTMAFPLGSTKTAQAQFFPISTKFLRRLKQIHTLKVHRFRRNPHRSQNNGSRANGLHLFSVYKGFEIPGMQCARRHSANGKRNRLKMDYKRDCINNIGTHCVLCGSGWCQK